MRRYPLAILTVLIWALNFGIGCAWLQEHDERSIYMTTLSPEGCYCECRYEKTESKDERTAGDGIR